MFSYVGKSMGAKFRQDFVVTLKWANLTVVREFYSNILHVSDNTGLVRDKAITFHNQAINRLYQLSDFKDDEWSSFFDGEMVLISCKA